ncbi:hypothetical protein TWF192_006773 [Orbilia oligospora]|uniref:Uncharacterized protein n=1 Tax=Orbilia oligospora TaxID=2813651 RepID=A0A6G1M757_ORBOL|nr:hypothetical protein TWF191_002346 [Orbilia oligospora]KAF3246615.1 hypothetical protein TWF192_006773 [Orbilia oligospora]
MTSTDIQSLLRFLTGPAKLPLRDAMSKAKPLLADGLSSPDEIAKAPLEKLKGIFTDERTAKQVHSAAKRTSKSSSSKKRSSSSTHEEALSPSSQNATGNTSMISPSKRRRTNQTPSIDTSDPQSWETGLDLPPPIRDENLISITTIITNRAPLLLAFTIVSLTYTHPWLPASSRFSLAQGLLDLTASSKAKSIGITRPDDAKNDTVEEGYKKLKVLSKEIPILRRWDTPSTSTTTSFQTETSLQKQGVSHKPDKPPSDDVKSTSIDLGPSASAAGDVSPSHPSSSSPSPSVLPVSRTAGTAAGSSTSARYPNEPIYWSLSPSLLSQPPTASKLNPSALPIHLPHAAHSYLTRSFSQDKLPLLLGALHLLYESWVNALDAVDLDRKSWNWYCSIRPTVEDGPEGWGGKGPVKLKDILSLRHKGGVDLR